MKKISVYVKGDRNSTAYYRIYQYLDRINGVVCNYHTMMSTKIHNKYMPVSKQPLFIKAGVYLHMYIRMMFCLVKDFIFLPDIIVVHRRVISRYMPVAFKLLLLGMIKRNVKLIWDFDDHIVNSGEVTASTFLFFAKYADTIIVTHEFLKSLVPESYQQKVILLPTTDGDMFHIFQSESINEQRLKIFDEGVFTLVWVATSGNLKHLEQIISVLDNAANRLIKEKSKELHLKVICDAPLIHNCKYLTVNNIEWTRERAIEGMKNAHVGIMPLQDNIFARGKGGFKLVQYLSIGLPCIGSDVGFNKHVISSDCGFLVNSNKQTGWIDSIVKLCDKKIWEKYSEHAFEHWEKTFSYTKNLLYWSNLLNRN